MEYKDEVILVPSLENPHSVFFIFRRNGQEIKITIKHNHIYWDRKITELETKFIQQNIITNG